jgi:prolipoprotein diacylglyceryltransferase
MSILIIWSSFRTNQLTFVGIGGFFFLMRSISRFILAFARRVARDVLDQLNILCVLCELA